MMVVHENKYYHSQSHFAFHDVFHSLWQTSRMPSLGKDESLQEIKLDLDGEQLSLEL